MPRIIRLLVMSLACSAKPSFQLTHLHSRKHGLQQLLVVWVLGQLVHGHSHKQLQQAPHAAALAAQLSQLVYQARHLDKREANIGCFPANCKRRPAANDAGSSGHEACPFYPAVAQCAEQEPLQKKGRCTEDQHCCGATTKQKTLAPP